jgi:hypothetical protein
MPQFTSGESRLKQGRARMREIAIENAVEIEKQVAHLVRGLGREPTAGELIESELIAVAIVRSRRLREQCKDDSKERRMLRELMRSTAFGSTPEMSPAERQHGKAVSDAIDRHNEQHGIAALHGYVDPDDLAADEATENVG